MPAGFKQIIHDTDLDDHESAADPHAGYVREADANWIDLTDAGETALHTHADGGLNLRRFLEVSCEFITTANFGSFTQAGILSGTQAMQAAVAGHPGIYRLNSSTNANSGQRILSNYASCYLIGGGEVAEMVFKTPADLTATTIRFGYHTANTITDAVDGVYFEITAGSIVGKTAKASARSTTGSAYNPGLSTWFRVQLVVNAAASRVDFYVYSEAGALLWTDYLTTNIPTAALNIGVVATNSGTTAVALMDLDAMAFYSIRDAR